MRGVEAERRQRRRHVALEVLGRLVALRVGQLVPVGEVDAVAARGAGAGRRSSSACCSSIGMQRVAQSRHVRVEFLDRRAGSPLA